MYKQSISLLFILSFLMARTAYCNLPPIIDIYQASDASSEIQRLRNEVQELKKQLTKAHETIHAQTFLLEKKPKKTLLKRLFTTQKKSLQTPSKQALQTQQATQDFEIASQRLKSKEYPEAIKAFKKLIQQYPQHNQCAFAYYTLAQLELLTGNPKQSLRYSKLFLKKYPDDSKAPDAQFCMGLAYYAQNNNAMAYKIFTQLVEHHPEQPIAKKAHEHLARLNLKTNL